MAKKIKYDFNPFALTGESAKGLGAKRGEVLDEIADYVTDQVRQGAAGERSVVSKRGKWRSLTSAAYIKKKGSRKADMELEGDMLGSLNTHRRSGNTLRTTYGEEEQKKADGHNNFTGNSDLPERRTIPNVADGETWNKAVIAGMREIIKRAKDDSE